MLKVLDLCNNIKILWILKWKNIKMQSVHLEMPYY